MKKMETRTATQAYNEHLAAIEALMDQLAAQLAAHKAEQAATPNSWGKVGDIEEVRDRLQSAVNFLDPNAE